ncbi:MAG: VTT domain-containing protein [Acetobacteraceae bacterium]|nr:VTT domain-containing protein [Acetobacteraceae bacterium]
MSEDATIPARAEAARRWRAVGRLMLLGLGLAAAGLVLRWVGLSPDPERLNALLKGQGALAPLLFVLLGAAATAAGLPRQAIAFLGGFGFGVLAGSALAMAGQLLGAAIAFGWARLVGRPWAERRLAGRFGPRLRPLVGTLRENPFGAALALRLMPIGNNLALNLVAGMSGIAALPFLAASAIGYLPQTVVFALLGKGVRVDGAWQIGLAGAMFAASVGLGLWLWRRHRAARALEP